MTLDGGSAEQKQATAPLVRKAIAVGILFLTLAPTSSCGHAAHTPQSDGAQTTPALVAAPAPPPAPYAVPTPASPTPDAALAPDFATVSKLMNDAIAAHTIPGG